MSRPAFRQTAGVALAVVALLLGITAAAALGWGGEQQGSDHGQAHGKKDHGKNEETGGKGGETTTTKKPTETTPPKTETTPPPTQTTPPTVTTLAPPPTVTTTATTPPTTVTTQLRPPTRTVTTPPSKTTPPSETTTTSKTPPIRQVAKRKRLAATGLNPVLMVLLGAGLLGGGSFLLRRSLLQR
jgi:hypothetical protein